MSNERCPKCSLSNIHPCYISPDEDMYKCRDCKTEFVIVHEEKGKKLSATWKVILFLFGAAFFGFLSLLMRYLGAH